VIRPHVGKIDLGHDFLPKIHIFDQRQVKTAINAILSIPYKREKLDNEFKQNPTGGTRNVL
jgi:hypothetical protein